MKFKFLLFVAALLSINASLFANPLFDSVGVKNIDGKKVVQWKIKAKDTYYSIGHRYNIKGETLMKYNGSKKAILSLGQTISIPTDYPFKKSSKTKVKDETAGTETKKEKKARLVREDQQAGEEALALKKRRHREEQAASESASEKTPVVATQPVTQPKIQQHPVQAAPVTVPLAQTATPAQQQTEPDKTTREPAPTPVQLIADASATPATQYKVSAGETLYSIAKRFNTSVEDLTKLNNLTTTNLQPGQMLFVKANTPPSPSPVIIAKRDSVIPSTIVKDSSAIADRKVNVNHYGLYEKNEKGVATWMDDASLDPNKKLVLHRTAPIGTVIKITNPMTNRTTFAKVVGRFTDNESNKDVIIVMTKNVADSLGALDKRFHVNISYGSPSE